MWHAEVDKWACKVLDKRFPGVPNLGDIKVVDWERVKGMNVGTHRCDERAQAMYERYLDGLSLAKVASEFDCTRQSVYKMFVLRGWELRPKPDRRDSVEWNGRTYSLRNNGYYGATDGDRGMLHRHVWMHANGPIPPNHDIHHKDKNRRHNDLTNLECIAKDEHARLHAWIKCVECDEEVMPPGSPAVDILTAGYP